MLIRQWENFKVRFTTKSCKDPSAQGILKDQMQV